MRNLRLLLFVQSFDIDSKITMKLPYIDNVINRKLEDQLRELREAKDELEEQQGELQKMMTQLEEAKNLEAEERRRQEEEIRAKAEEIEEIRAVVEAKERETEELQQEVDMSKQKLEVPFRFQNLLSHEILPIPGDCSVSGCFHGHCTRSTAACRGCHHWKLRSPTAETVN